MPQLKYKDIKPDGSQETFSIARFYENKYYSLFINSYKFSNLTSEQQRYLLTEFWTRGCINAFILEGSVPEKTLQGSLSNSSPSTVATSENPNGLLIFTPFASSQFNIYNYPTVIIPINTRGASFIKTKPMIVGKDCVIGFAHPSHAPIRSLVMFYVEQIANVENTIRTNLFVHKLPRLIICTPEDRARVDELMNKIESGEHKLFLAVDDWQAIKNVLDSGGSYIIDKLYQYKQALENELLTFLGIDNIGLEKRERLIVDEANSNNAIINDHSDSFIDCMKDFCEEVSKVLKYPLTVEAKSSPATSEYQKNEEDTTNVTMPEKND